MAAATSPVLCSVDARGVATVTLNRPEVHNAYDGALIAAHAAKRQSEEAAEGFAAFIENVPRAGPRRKRPKAEEAKKNAAY